MVRSGEETETNEEKRAAEAKFAKVLSKMPPSRCQVSFWPSDGGNTLGNLLQEGEAMLRRQQQPDNHGAAEGDSGGPRYARIPPCREFLQ